MNVWRITVDGFCPMLYAGDTAAKARWRCYKDYREAYDSSFRDFISRVSVRRVPNLVEMTFADPVR